MSESFDEFLNWITSKHHLIITGFTGTGKTYMLNLARELLHTKNKEFIALAPSSSATKLLNDDANIQNHNTLQYFITRYQRYQNIDNIQQVDLIKTKEYFQNNSQLLIFQVKIVCQAYLKVGNFQTAID